jgi:sugar fermentation stimulation protein A
MRTPGLTEFPDSVTTRGAKHLSELSDRVRAGSRAIQLFIVQRGDCTTLSPARDLDPHYAKALDDAARAGVEIIAYACNITLEGVTVDRQIEVKL